jgi:tetratricopeptide (TPR) repeat protein/CheY-like chemotaxis protein
MSDLHLGPFFLEAPIGRGAMGDVWKARHKDRGIPAAIKVLHGKSATNPQRLKGFFNETRAVAQLDHPGIAWVLDYGTINAAAAEASEGRLIADSPYLAMEYASRGTLAEVEQEYNWSELRAILLALLDALAHAHARGVIHRDLKPANVLLCSRKDVRPGLKLCDFGIAFAMEDARDDSTVAGTLHYMAPEQLEGRQREQGPWTDLYALGCLTWRLLTGKPPFAGKRQTQLMFAQLQEDPPLLITPTPMPDGFEPWLRTLLAKDPLHRFRCAADAARGLLDLGHPDLTEPEEDLRTGIVEPILMARTELDQLETEAQTADHGPLGEMAELAAEPMTLFLDGATIAWRRPGLPTSPNQIRAGLPMDWRRPAPARPALDLVGAGLNLFGLRKAAFTGREAERDRLWEMLTQVHKTRRAHGMILHGESGTGKTRLASWIAQRAAEVGAASVLSARFSGADEADGPLRTMLLRRFSALGMDGDDLRDRLVVALDDLGITSADLRRQAIALLTGEQLQGASRYVVIRLLLEAISRDRPVVLLLDDLHAGIDGIRFARHLHNAQAVRPFPILLLMTVRLDLLEQNDLTRELAALEDDKRVGRLAVEPLPREPFMEIVQDLLGLEPDLAAQVVDRTAGNPLFAIQLVGDWVERDHLELGSRGFKLKKGVRAQLPPSLKYVWVKRLARVLDGTDDETQHILEAAAVLGMEVDELEWSGMCDDPEGLHRQSGRMAVNPDNARRRARLIEALLQQNLAQETEQGFSFTHGQFRDAILDRARAYKRLRAHHRAAACQLGVDIRDTELERYGRHLLAAGEREAALDPLLRAVPAIQATVGRMSAWRLLDTIEHTLKRLDLPRSDVRWGRLYIERSQLAEFLGRHGESVKWAGKAGSEASRHRWTTIAAAANFRLARDAMRRGDLDMANARFVRVTNQLDPTEEPFMVGEALFLLGTVGRRSGEPVEEVAKLMKAGRTWMLKDPDPRRRVRALIHLARAALESGQPGTCAALIERARKVAIEIGDLPQQVQCLAYAAEVARENGQLDAAAAKLRRAIEVFELIGDAQLALLRCNLAIVLLDQGDTSAALKELERGLSNAIEVDRDPLLLAVQSVRVRAFADARRYPELDDALRAARQLTGTVRVGERDAARSAERAYDLLLGAGEPQRAEQARLLAIDQYTKIGDDDAVARLETP